ncbi:MAG: hypothetical protein HC906_19235 [Bacteroidales bacterium]|nr:hypothetical protein [Bacteroidales bacterium]
MKIILSFLLIFLSVKMVSSQQISILVKNIYSHTILENDKVDQKKAIVNQKPYDEKNRLIIKRNYDIIKGAQKDYMLFFL